MPSANVSPAKSVAKAQPPNPALELKGAELHDRPEAGCGAKFLLWQLADSAFPTGGFAHSNGLEAAWQHGAVRDPAELETFVEASLWQFGRGSLPLVTAAHRDPSRFDELDQLCETFTLNHVANRASRAQGRALLSAAQSVFGLPIPAGDQGKVRHWHWSPVFGFVTAGLRIDLDSARRLSVFLHLRGLMASAVRLGLVGPIKAQTLQHRLGPSAEQVLDRCQNLPTTELAQVSPLLDLWQGTQDRLYSRLFQS